MTRKTFYFAEFDPAISENVSTKAPLVVFEPAPEGHQREYLKTRIHRTQSPHDEFHKFSLTHDISNKVRAYTDEGVFRNSDDPSDTLATEVVQEQYFVTPKDYQAFELSDHEGRLYTSMPENYLRQMYRRYRESATDPMDFALRIVDISKLVPVPCILDKYKK